VGEGEREGSGTTDLKTVGVVLGTVARALELVLRGYPRHDATKMGADGVEAELLDGVVGLDDEVRRVTLETLGESAVTRLVGSEPLGLLDVSAEGILGNLQKTIMTGRWIDKDEWKET